jgi:hypothetical protein
LKEDLINRLNEALHAERETTEASPEQEAAVGSEKDGANGLNAQVGGVKDSQTDNVDAEVIDTIEKEFPNIR